MSRPWSKVTKLLQAKDGAGLIELLTKTPPLKEERLNQVLEGLRGLDAPRVMAPALAALARNRLAPEVGPRMERLLLELCRREGVQYILAVVRADPGSRSIARGLVRQLDPSRNLKQLIELLAQEDPELKRWARDIIRGYPPEATIPELLKGMEGPANLRLSIVEILGLLRNQQAIKPLIGLLGKARGPMMEATKQALARFGALVIEPLLKVISDGTRHEKEAARSILDTMGELPIDTRVKIHLLQGEEEQLRELGPRAFETLIEAIRWKDPRHRFMAAMLLGDMQDPRAVKALERLLNDGDPPVRHVALEGLGKLGQVDSLDPLLKGLNDPHEEVARTAASALGKLGAPGIEGLVQAVQSDEGKIHQRAGRALLNLGQTAIDPLWRAFENSNTQLKERYAQLLGRSPDLDMARRVEILLRAEKPGALGRLGPEAISYLVQALGDLDDRRQRIASSALTKMGTVVVEPLVIVMAEDDLRRRRASLQTLLDLGQPAFDGLLKGLENQDPRMRRDSARALGALGEGKALTALSKALKDPEIRVGKEAAQALISLGAPGIKQLGRSGSELGIEPLKTFLLDGTQLVKETTEALVALGLSARKGLEEALNHKHSSVRRQAARALGQLKEGPSAPALLRTMADEEGEVREAAQEAMVALGKGAVQSLIRGLEKPHWFVRQGSAIALGRICDPRALEPLVSKLADSDRSVVAEVKKALINYDKLALGPLVNGLDEAPDMELRTRLDILRILGRTNLESLLNHYKTLSDGSPRLEMLLRELAPERMTEQYLEGLEGDDARSNEGVEDAMRTGMSLSPEMVQELEDLTPQDRSGTPEGEVEIKSSQREKDEPLTRPWEPTSDVSTQLQRLIIAHREGLLTDVEFARAKEKLLGI